MNELPPINPRQVWFTGCLIIWGLLSLATGHPVLSAGATILLYSVLGAFV